MPIASTLAVKIEKTADTVIVQLIGEVGLGGVDELERGLRPVLAARCALSIIDMSGLKFISSLGLGLLVELQRGITRNGGVVRFAALQPLVRDAIVKCRLDAVLPLFASVDEALHAA